jgi:hypothetical protein
MHQRDIVLGSDGVDARDDLLQRIQLRRCRHHLARRLAGGDVAALLACTAQCERHNIVSK